MARGFGARESAASTSLPMSFDYKSSLKPDEDFGYKLSRFASYDRGAVNVVGQVDDDFKALEEQAKKVIGSLSAESRAAVERLLKNARDSTLYIGEQAETMERINGRNSDTPPDETVAWQSAESEAQSAYHGYLKEKDEIMGYLSSKNFSNPVELSRASEAGMPALLDYFKSDNGKEVLDAVMDRLDSVKEDAQLKAFRDNSGVVRTTPGGKPDENIKDQIEVEVAGHKYSIEFKEMNGKAWTTYDKDGNDKGHVSWSREPRDADDLMKNWTLVSYLGPAKK